MGLVPALKTIDSKLHTTGSADDHTAHKMSVIS
jgi:hypothetical protein